MTATDTPPPAAPVDSKRSGAKIALVIIAAVAGLMGLVVLALAGMILVVRSESTVSSDPQVSSGMEATINLGTLGAECVNTAQTGASGSLCFVDGNDGLKINATGFEPGSLLSIRSDSGSVDTVIDPDGTMDVVMSGSIVNEARFVATGTLNNASTVAVTVNNAG